MALLISMPFFNCSKNEINREEENKDDCDRDAKTNFTIVKQNNLGGVDGDFGLGVVTSNNGGYIVCGITEDEKAYIVSTNSNLSEVWNLVPDNLGVSSFENIIKTRDGNYVAAGFKQTIIDDIDFDLYAIKVNNSGDIIWEKTYGVNSITDTTIDLTETSNGDIILVGSKIKPPVTLENFNTDISVTRIDANGNLLWNNVFGGTDVDSAASILEEANGNILVCGSTASTDGDITKNKGKSDAWVFRINSTGELLEESTFGSSENDGAISISKLNNGNIIVVGSSNGSDNDVNENNGQDDIWIFTLNSSLNIVNQNSIGNNNADFAFKIIETNNNELMLAGSTNDDTSADDLFGKTDFWLLKLSASLQVVSQEKFGGSAYEYPSNMILNENNEVVMVGSSNSNDCDVMGNNGDFDIWVTVIEDVK